MTSTARDRSRIVLPPLCLLALLQLPSAVWADCADPPDRRVNWLRCDKQGADLQGVDLREAVLTQVNLTNAKLTGARLSGADLGGATLTGVDFTNATLTNARLVSAKLENAVLVDASMAGARLDRAVLTQANLSNADLSGARLYQADLTGANLSGAKLDKANLAQANLTDAKLPGVVLNGAVLSRAVLENAVLNGAQLRGAKLDGANLLASISPAPIWPKRRWPTPGSTAPASPTPSWTARSGWIDGAVGRGRWANVDEKQRVQTLAGQKWRKFMSSITTELARLLDTVQRPGDFYATGSTEIFAPSLEVDGVGPIALPLLPVQAEQLIAVAEQAPYGRGEETLVDTAVRRTWQIDAARVRIGGRHWPRDLEAIVQQAAAGLGVTQPVVAELYKLLVYDQGSFFVNHRDTEKAPGMFATLIIVLPSRYTGGELVVRHRDREARLDLRGPEPSEVAFAAFYADCVHEVLPITSGCRLTLVYNLLLRPGKGRLPEPPSYETEQAAVVDLLRQWAADKESPDDDSPEKLIYPLEHAYTPAALGFDALKGADAAAASVLVPAAEQADCDLHLALVSIEESGSAEYTGYYGSRRRWGRSGRGRGRGRFRGRGGLRPNHDAERMAAARRQPVGTGRLSLRGNRTLSARCVRRSGAGRAAFPRSDRQRRRVLRPHLPPGGPGAVAAPAAARGAQPGRPVRHPALSGRTGPALDRERRRPRITPVAPGARVGRAHAAHLAEARTSLANRYRRVRRPGCWPS